MGLEKQEDMGTVELGAVESVAGAGHLNSNDQDQDDLVRLGKKPVLKVCI